MLEKKALEHGGLISYKSEADGSQSPYELNITWWNAINRDDINESEELQIRRYQASRNIALTMIGVPAFYVHGLLATKNDRSGVSRSGIYRDINRKIINVKALEKTIFDDKSLTYRVVSQFGELIDKRTSEKAFHPNSSQSVIDVSDAIFCLLRTSNDKSEHILTLTNVTDKTQHIVIDTKRFGLKANAWVDLLSEKHHPSPKSELSCQLEPYDILWLKAQ